MDAAARKPKIFTEKKAKTFFQKRLHQREIECGLTDVEVTKIDRSTLYARMKGAIGNTELKRFELPNGNVILQKNETGNPTETHYDRCYVELIQNLEQEGKITPGDILLETTSGSAGVSFAWVCKKLGYKAIVFMPAFVPEPRIVEVENLATAVHLSDDKNLYLLACAENMVKYYKENLRSVRRSGKNIFMPNHSQDFLTPKTFAKIMDEVATQADGRAVDYFIGGIGNGSTLLGVGERIKQINPNSKIVAFEPVSACPFYKRHRKQWGKVGPVLVDDSDVPDDYSFHRLPGTGSYGNVDFPFMDIAFQKNIIDDICPVPDGKILDSVTYNHALDEEYKLGNSSLVSRYIAEALAEKISNSTILILAYDRADRYGTPRYMVE